MRLRRPHERTPTPTEPYGRMHRRRAVQILFACVLLATTGCVPYAYVPFTPRATPALGEQFRTHAQIQPFYVTDRRHTNVNKPDVIYAGLRGSEVYYGACTASVPEQHGRGRIERPLIPSLANRDDAMLLLDVTPPQDEDWFVTAFNRRIAKSPNRAVFVFVHGYYINFHDAALRTAQIAHDIRFDGVAVSYSWPSADIFFGYLIDADNAEWSIPHFVDFLDVLVDRTDAEEIYILAHSMGTRIVARGLREFARSRAAGDRRVFKEVVFAAADIDSEIFGRDYAPHVVDTAERLTIYMSNADWALGGSRRLHGYDRLGQTSVADESEPWFNRVDLIDATAVDHGIVGHVYYSCSPTVLEDIEQLIAGKSPQERGLKKSKRVNEIEPIDWSARSESSVGDPATRQPATGRPATGSS